MPTKGIQRLDTSDRRGAERNIHRNITENIRPNQYRFFQTPAAYTFFGIELRLKMTQDKYIIDHGRLTFLWYFRNIQQEESVLL